MRTGVVAAVESVAANVGGDVLRSGGNAADAAVSTIFAQCVVAPLMCGLGGGLTAMVARGDGKVEFLEALGRSPLSATEDMFRPAGDVGGTLFRVEGERNKLGYEASTVPSFVRGAWDLYATYGSGKIAWAALLEPAIDLAENGVDVYPSLWRSWSSRNSAEGFFGIGWATINVSDEAKRVFLKPDGETYEIGEVFRQPDYARTLRRLASDPEDMYSGELAQRIVEDFTAHGGYITQADLKACQSRTEPPIRGRYRGLDVVTEGLPSTGVTFVEALNVLDQWDIQPMGWNSAEYLAHIAYLLNLVFRDRRDCIGDPSKVQVPVERLLSAAYARGLAGQVEAFVGQRSSQAAPARELPGEHLERQTTHMVAADTSGMIVQVIHSIGSGSGIITPGLGFMHNNHMIMFDPRPGQPNSIGPAKLGNNGGAPVLVREAGRNRLAMGSPGGMLKTSAMLQVIANIVDFGMSPGEAISVPRIHADTEWMTVTVQPHFDPRVLVELGRRGFHVVEADQTARVQLVSVDRDGTLVGASDPRGDRGVAYG
jgi:gamma-glutamyltranspeptidase / glutathione hydrolase